MDVRSSIGAAGFTKCKLLVLLHVCKFVQPDASDISVEDLENTVLDVSFNISLAESRLVVDDKSVSADIIGLKK